MDENNGTLYILSIPEPFTKYISDEVVYWAEIIGHVGLSGTVSTFGIIANIINIIVFIRQGVLKDSNTISLFFLSISDLFSLIFLIWISICFMLVYIQPPNLPFNPMDMLYVNGGRFHLIFVQISGWFTAYISFERCMCVVFPFRVRRIFTAKRTATVLLTIVILIIFVGHLNYFLYEYLVWGNDPNTNKSMLVIYHVLGNATLDTFKINAVLNIFVSQPLTLFLIFLFTQITVFRVNSSRKWRIKTSASSSKTKSQKGKKQKNEENDSTTISKNEEDADKHEASKTPESKGNTNPEVGSREKRLTKMISIISAIFIACMTPVMVIIVVELLEPDIAPGAKQHNLFFFNYAISFFLGGVNCSINIFVYYNMSTKYRCEFRKLFGMKERK